MKNMQSRVTIAIPPGETIKEMLEYRGIKQKEFAIRMDMSEKHISRLINGEVILTQETASKLEIVLGMKASFWLELESIYRQDLLKIKAELDMDEDIEFSMQFPYVDMAKNGWIPDTTNAIERVHNLCKFFEVLHLLLLQKMPLWPTVACKRLAVSENADIATIVWAQKARIEARRFHVDQIKLRQLKNNLKVVKDMCNPDEWVDQVQKELQSYGVVLLLLPPVGDAYIQGVSFVDGPRIVIALNSTLSNDILKKNFAHELAHIILGHINLKNGTELEHEEAADKWALEFAMI